MKKAYSTSRLDSLLLVEDWYTVRVLDGVDLNLPGIYEWTIEGVGTYIGKYTRISRPLREYQRNIAKIRLKHPYRPKNPEGFRRIHRALAEAQGGKVTLTILENVAPEILNAREAELIRERGTLNGKASEKGKQE